MPSETIILKHFPKSTESPFKFSLNKVHNVLMFFMQVVPVLFLSLNVITAVHCYTGGKVYIAQSVHFNPHLFGCAESDM